MIQSLIDLIIVILVAGLVAGILVYLIDASPIAQPFKMWARWLVIVVAVLIILVRALPLLGVGV